MIAFTIVSRAYLPFARVLARSFTEHHPGQVLHALLIDDVGHAVTADDEPFAVVRPEDLGLERAEFHRMAMLFGSRLIAAIKPWAFEHLRDRSGDAVIYIDSDIAVYHDISLLADGMSSGVILVPHVLSPVPRDGRDPDETKLLGVGTFNAGLFGTAPGDGGFLAFLKERLRRECRFDVPAMRVNEQRWLDFVPSLFPHRVIRDPGIDVAYWNLHERPLRRVGDTLYAGDAPLRCFHFSSFDPRMRGIAGRYEIRARPRCERGADPLLDQMCTDYSRRLLEEGFDRLHRVPFAFDYLPDGRPVYDTLRALYASALMRAESAGSAVPPDPFDPDCSEEFHVWATEAYRAADLPLPARLVPRTARAVTAPPSPSPSPGAVDWLGSLDIGSAAAADLRGSPPAGASWAAARVARVRPDAAGFVVYGPRAQLDPGDYLLTVELATGPRSPGVSGGSQALIAEVRIEGYVAGATAASFDDIEGGSLVVEFAVPSALAEAALLDGVELRLLSRGLVDAAVTAVIVEPTGSGRRRDLADVAPSDWLPFMAAGEAGRRDQTCIELLPGATGVVAYGPNWRLPAGSYTADIQIRNDAPAPLGSEDRHGGGERSPRRAWHRKGRPEAPALSDPLPSRSAPIGTLDIVVEDSVVAEQPLTAQDFVAGHLRLSFELGPELEGPNGAVGVRLRISEASPVAGGTLRSVRVEPTR